MDHEKHSDFPRDTPLHVGSAGNGRLDTGQDVSQSGPIGLPVGAGDRLSKNLYGNPAAAAAGSPTGQNHRASPPRDNSRTGSELDTVPRVKCSAEGCFKVFRTKQGLGQHIRHAHPEEYNASINTSRKKARWCDEEKQRLAALEVRFERERSARKERSGAVKGINETLNAAFPDRTLDAIRCRRRNPQHKEMVAEARKREENKASTAETTEHPSPRVSNECDQPTVVAGDHSRGGGKKGQRSPKTTPKRKSRPKAANPQGPSELPPDCDHPLVVAGGLQRDGGEKGQRSPKSKRSKRSKVSTDWQATYLSDVEEEDEHAEESQTKLLELTRALAQTQELTGATAQNEALSEERPYSVPGEDFESAVLALAADLALDVYGGETLRSIALRACAGEEIRRDLNQYIADHLVRERKEAPVQKKERASKKPKKGKRKQRRAEYARVQNLYQKSRLRCAQEVLDGPQVSKVTDHRGFVDFWKRTMTEMPLCPPLDVNQPNEILGDIWVPVTRDDVRRSLPPCSTATGPDGMTARELRSVPFTHLALLMNLILWIGEVPRILAVSRTTFIPKVPEATRPEDFRPIAVAPNLLRMLHKVLARRIQGSVEFDVRQRAFIPADGCGENIAILQALLTESKRTLRPLHMATMDLRKAFDSVTVEAVLGAAKAVGLPPSLIQYLEYLYEESRTTVESGGLKQEVKAARGVKQGDPLSPLLFNLVVDELLKELPTFIGFRLGETTINAMAFADDLTLVASTRAGLQQLLDQSEAFFKARGLSFNARKSTTLSLVPSGRQKKIKVEEVPFQVEGTDIPTLSCVASWKYLGITFNTRGKKVPMMGELAPLLERLTSAPLKPQQRLALLRHYLLPRLYHKGTFQMQSSKLLRRLDTTVRAAVRRWLRLPHDTPVGYFHAPVAEGGLGIPALRHTLPRLKLQRIAMLRLSSVPACLDAVKCPAIIHEERKAKDLLTVNGEILSTAREISDHWTDLLHKSVDGGPLRECASVPESHNWVAAGTRLLSGRDFVDCTRLRINAMPTLARTSRGRDLDITCRAGCREAETLSHALQQCHRTHGARIKRHDGIVKYLCRKFHKDGWQVEREPQIKTREGTRIPDLVIWKDEELAGGKRRRLEAAIVDVQIVGTAAPLDVAHRRKKSYYAGNDEVVAYAKSNMEGAPIVTSCTLSYRGVWSPTSRTDLRGLGVTKGDAGLISVRTLQGSLAVFGAFRRSTSRCPNAQHRGTTMLQGS